MTDLMKYKSFAGTVEYSAADKCLHGQIVGIPDKITYEGADLDELHKYFKQAVLEYIEDCNRLGKPTRKTYTGHFSVRVKPRTHEKLDYLAHSNNTSVSKIIEEAVSQL